MLVVAQVSSVQAGGVCVAVGVDVAVGVGSGGVGVGVDPGPQIRNKIETLSESALATAKSCLPSPLKSPTAIETGALATPKFPPTLKLPAPSPNKIDTLSEPMLATTRSCLPSPLKSPTATE